MFSLLPTSLLALLFASPSLSAPTTPNDLFHDIAVHAPKRPEEPVCCLRPLTPLEPVAEDDILLSFEDWKAKRLSEVKEQETVQASPHKAPETLSESTVVPNASHAPSQAQGSASAVDVQESGGPPELLAPHFRIPLTDRFNYASLDCSARIHGAHKSAKGAASILSSKKDRYMLSPCGAQGQFVIVELCEDIRIDTVQLANYEFFSGVFKDFTLSVAKKITGEWVPAGTFRAKNVRGVQSFHTPPTLRDFYRYIRIDFHSHYGSEYYCPVSLLRVYGLTHLEEWQWETWEAESRAKRSIEEASAPVEVIAEPPEPAPSPSVEPPVQEQEVQNPAAGVGSTMPSSTHSIPVTSDILNSLHFNLSTPSTAAQSHSASDTTNTHGEPAGSPAKTHVQDASHDSARHDHLYNSPVSLSSPSSSHAHSSASDPHSSPASSSSSSVFIDHNHSDPASHAHSHSSSSSSPSSSSSVRASSATPNVSSLTTISASYVAPPVSTGGENIYRTIMNRLLALEGNTTLYARYVEEQTAGMREVLRRLNEDIGRLEGIGKAQAQLYQRSVVELERHTRRLENEQRELLSRVNLLTDEVVLEKRLGIAQLCLLLTVLVFMALTRGSRGEVAYPPVARGTVREWGRRTLSFSGDLVNRLRARSPTPPRPTPPRAGGQKPGEHEIAFPSVESDDQRRMRRALTHSTGGNARRATVVRPHTPTSIRTPTHRHFVHHAHRAGAAVPASPSYAHHAFGPRPAIQRSSSGGIALGPVPKSAKRWARSAHLHEVKLAGRQSGGADTPVPTSGSPGQGERDVFEVDDADEAGGQILVLPQAMSRSDTLTLGMSKGKGVVRQPSPLRPAPVVDLSSPPARGRGRGRSRTQSEGDGSEGDAWVDTDVDGSECDLVVDAGAGEGVRERTYIVPVANSSL